jgi:hypothetical protein
MSKKAVTKTNEDALPSLALVFGYMATKELGLDQDKVRVLSRLGYGNEQIGRIIDKTAGNVSVIKARLKKTKH